MDFSVYNLYFFAVLSFFYLKFSASLRMVRTRRNSGLFFEDPAEVIGIIVSDLFSNLRNRTFRVFQQQFLGLVDTKVDQILKRRDSELLFKGAAHIGISA